MENLINDAIVQNKLNYDNYIKSRNVRDELIISFLNDYKSETKLTTEIRNFKLESFKNDLSDYLDIPYDNYENSWFIVTSVNDIITNGDHVCCIVFGFNTFSLKINLNEPNKFTLRRGYKSFKDDIIKYRNNNDSNIYRNFFVENIFNLYIFENIINDLSNKNTLIFSEKVFNELMYTFSLLK